MRDSTNDSGPLLLKTLRAHGSITPLQASVTQLLPGGLEANFWDNQGLLGAPVVRRVDPEVRW